MRALIRTRFLAAAIVLTAAALAGPAQAQDISNWSHSARVMFDNTAATEDLVDFPVAIRLDFAGGYFDGAEFQAGGSDLRFQDPDGTDLPYEVEKWDTAGVSVVWVKVPTIDLGSADDYIMMHWGYAGAWTPPAASVWSNGFTAVWHMGEADIVDSAGSNDGAATGGPAIGAGLLGDCLDITNPDGNVAAVQYVTVPNAPGIEMETSDFTMSAWIYRDRDSVGSIFAKQTGLQTGGFNFLSYSLERMTFRVRDAPSPYFITNSNVVPSGAWSHLVVVREGQNLRWYINGQLEGNHTDPLVATNLNQNSDLLIARRGGTNWNYDGRIDEGRFAKGAVRSASWIKAGYDNQKENQTFVTIPSRRHVVNTGGLASGEGLTWGTAWTLAHAVANAGEYDTIWVEAGNYATGEINVKTGQQWYGGFDGTEEDLDDRDLTDPANETILDAGGGSRVFYLNNFADMRIDGFTVTGGYVTGTYSNGAGGGIGFGGNSTAGYADSVAIANCHLTGNTAEPQTYSYGGGGLYSHIATNLAVENCRFTSNTVICGSLDFTGGGGASLKGLDAASTVTDCVFQWNRVERGTAVAPDGGFDDGAYQGGGGLYLRAPDTGFSLANCRFVENTVDGGDGRYGGGGGIFTSSRPLPVSDCVFRGNRVTGSLGDDDGGGAILVVDCELQMTDCVLEGNSVEVADKGNGGPSGGGAVYVYDSSDVTIDGCDIFFNEVIAGTGLGEKDTGDNDTGGGGILFRNGGANLTIRNSRIVGNARRVVDTAFSGNQHHGGGGILYYYTTQAPSIVDSYIVGNYTEGGGHLQTSGGGGILFRGPVNAQVTGCVLSGNTTTDRVGGAVMGDQGPDAAEFLNCLFSGNVVDIVNDAQSNSRHAGSVYWARPNFISPSRATSVTLTNCTVADNQSQYGALAAWQASAGYLNFINAYNTIVANNNEGGVYLASSSNGDSLARLVNCLFDNNASNNVFRTNGNEAFNTESEINDTFSYTGARGCVVAPVLFEDSLTGTWGASVETDTRRTTLTVASSSQALAPGDLVNRLIHPDAADKLQALILDNSANTITVSGEWSVGGQAFSIPDYRLKEGSGAVDTADPALSPSDDINGNFRPIIIDFGAADHYDIGAYERQVPGFDSPASAVRSWSRY